MRILAIFKEIKSFRLGYTEERPYPWRWTTPIVLCAFLLISPFLALVNVPLSAYNIVQEFTYHPNDTLPAVFLGKLVPSVLQNPTGSFTPQILDVGYTILLDNYIFNYTIAQAFDGVDTSKSVSAFSYYNNPLSDSYDVANITVQLSLGTESGGQVLQVGGTVACYVPTPFYLSWSGLPESDDSIRGIPYSMSLDFGEVTTEYMRRGPMESGATLVDISFTVHPYCDCDAVLADGLLENGTRLLQTPCSSNPPHFVVVANATMVFYYTLDEEEGLPPTEDLVTGNELGSYPMQIADLLAQTELLNISSSGLSIACENLLQTGYHLVRVDLGVILDNQIYSSPDMFNRSIMPSGAANFLGTANESRSLTSDATVMAQWQQEVEFFPNNTRVPPLEYLRSVPRLKPLGSAMTSVFVSTFAMLSVMWTVFSLVAGTLARKHSEERYSEQSRTSDKLLESSREETDGSEVISLIPRKEPDAVERLRQKGLQMRASLARMRAALVKHGIMEDEDWVQDNDKTVE
ncbi:hypothetical protein MSAN_00479400 [Mycena sanguinolenta]|uniref:Transmembrane protein n=1 Tax=Mycena sanguinolenta TaxID=230812 RepID=A0A8H6ZBN8_9AGAR|nr:hypothetical protein MSAN_00479400 [Mycena sanguinolenta]